jgi:hypothetical protein
MENVKFIIMAGEEKPTFIAHPIPPSASSLSESSREEGDSQGRNLEGNQRHLEGQQVNPNGEQINVGEVRMTTDG